MVVTIILSLLIVSSIIIMLRMRAGHADEIVIYQEAMSKLLSQKKSSEVRVGFIAEHLAPLLKEFPVDVTRKDVDLIPMGNPVDYMIFTPEKVIAVEVKSGKAKLSKKQRDLQKLLEPSDIFDFHLMRIDPESDKENING